MSAEIPPEGPIEFSPEDVTPPTQPEGALVPPGGRPPTAVSAGAEQPEWSQRFRESWRRPGWRPPTAIARVLAEVLDAVDSFADRLAAGLRLR